MTDEPTITIPAHLFRDLIEAAFAVCEDARPDDEMGFTCPYDDKVDPEFITALRAALEPLKDWRDAA